MTKYISKIKVGNAEYPIKDTAAATRIEELQQSVNNVTTTPGPKGDDGITPHIDSTTGNWFIGDTNTGVKAQGVDGKSAYQVWLDDGNSGTISEFLNSLKGQNGTNGQDGVTPHIGPNGNWFIGETDTNVKAQGDVSVTQEQVDWNVTDTTSKAFIKNKPSIPEVDNALSDSSTNPVENQVVKAALDNKITNGGGIETEVALTKAEYNALSTKGNTTMYVITDEPVEERANVFKVCIVTSNTVNISSLVQQYSLIPNNVIILTGMDDTKTYEYTLNGSTKTFKGDSDHDLMFRYVGNNEFKPIVFGIL